MYEHRRKQPISRTAFAARVARRAGWTLPIVLASLFVGMAGYHVFEEMPWTDAFLNAAMLLGGMGPVDPIRTEAGKLFAGCYALYAGLVFLIVTGLVLAPFFHRVLHRFHWDADQAGS